jgi:solute carrier family 25 carnitine/acylcarnitine transporter 20/29
MEKHLESNQKEAPLFQYQTFAAGSLAGIAQVIVGQPFDTVKVRIVTQSRANPVYSSALECARSIKHTEGASSFYKGVASPLVCVSFSTAIQFASYNFAKSMMVKENLRNGMANPESFSIAQYGLMGAFAGLGYAQIAAPMEHIRTRLQVKSVIQKYSGAYDCLSKITRKHGVSGVYKGYSTTCVRDMIFFSLYFGPYEITKQYLLNKNVNSTLATVAGGVSSGVAAWTVTYPLDYLKTKIQTSSLRNK